MMLDATQHYHQPLTAHRLFDWHAALFPTGRSGMSKINVGRWRDDKKGPMQVISGPIGKERIHYEAPTTGRLRGEMKKFLEWFEREHSTDLVLKAGLAHLWFVTIHPFDDGNGRIASHFSEPAHRLLTLRPARSPSRPWRPSTSKASPILFPPPTLRLLPGRANQFPGESVSRRGSAPLHGALFTRQ